MKYVDEFRDREAVRRLRAEIHAVTTRPWTLMEVCGGQTHAIVRFGLDELLPAGVTLVHGPGCPVCVTPTGMIDAALDLAARDGVTFCSFGDMLRVPGSGGDLQAVRARGGDVRAVYSPLDAVAIAEAEPQREVVFFAVGFETTAPANALAVQRAHALGLPNFSLLVSHVRVPPAIEAVLAAPDNRVQAFLAAGHVCAVMGEAEYRPLVARYRVPIAITGFEPVDILDGILACLRQLEAGEARLENRYARSVRADGNPTAREVVERVFVPTRRAWRGMGELPESGLALREPYHRYDAVRRFAIATADGDDAGECIAGAVLRGVRKPGDCPAFGTRCTPEHPLGATMVSAEGACAAYYHYRGTVGAGDGG